MADHYVYVIECADGTLYTGYTTDVQRRVAEHDAGQGARYTRGRTPVLLRHVESFPSRSSAQSREAEIKSWSRDRKLELLSSVSAADRRSKARRAEPLEAPTGRGPRARER